MMITDEMCIEAIKARRKAEKRADRIMSLKVYVLIPATVLGMYASVCLMASL